MELFARPFEMYPNISHLKKKKKNVATSGTILFSYLVFTLGFFLYTFFILSLSYF